MKAFILSHFGYCPLVWIFHSRKLNNRINKIHEKSLRIVYKDYLFPFEELLKRDSSFKIHERNIQFLAIELYKVVNNLSPVIMKEVFLTQTSSTTRSNNPFIRRNVRTSRYGTETLSHLGPKIWSIIPNDIKKADTLKSCELPL